MSAIPFISEKLKKTIDTHYTTRYVYYDRRTTTGVVSTDVTTSDVVN